MRFPTCLRMQAATCTCCCLSLMVEEASETNIYFVVSERTVIERTNVGIQDGDEFDEDQFPDFDTNQEEIQSNFDDTDWSSITPDFTIKPFGGERRQRSRNKLKPPTVPDVSLQQFPDISSPDVNGDSDWSNFDSSFPSSSFEKKSRNKRKRNEAGIPAPAVVPLFPNTIGADNNNNQWSGFESQPKVRPSGKRNRKRKNNKQKNNRRKSRRSSKSSGFTNINFGV